MEWEGGRKRDKGNGDSWKIVPDAPKVVPESSPERSARSRPGCECISDLITRGVRWRHNKQREQRGYSEKRLVDCAASFKPEHPRAVVADGKKRGSTRRPQSFFVTRKETCCRRRANPIAIGRFYPSPCPPNELKSKSPACSSRRRFRFHPRACLGKERFRI